MHSVDSFHPLSQSINSLELVHNRATLKKHVNLAYTPCPVFTLFLFCFCFWQAHAYLSSPQHGAAKRNDSYILNTYTTQNNNYSKKCTRLTCVADPASWYSSFVGATDPEAAN